MSTAPTAVPRLRKTRITLLAAIAALTVAWLAGCGSSSSSGAPTMSTGMSSMSSMPVPSGSSVAAETPSVTTIHISDYRFLTPAAVEPGATVSVMNMDGETHTVTADSGNAFDVNAPGGTTVSFRAPSKPGRYPFHCTYHSNMHGVLVVR